METPIMLVGLVLLAVAIGPLVGINMASKQKEKKLRKALAFAEEKYQLKFSRTELAEDHAFALDESKGVFMLVHLSPTSQKQDEVINLNEVKDCRFSPVPGFENPGSEDEVSDLIFTFRDPKKRKKVVPFYFPEVDNSMDLKHLQITAKSWAIIMNQLVSRKANKLDLTERLQGPSKREMSYPKAG